MIVSRFACISQADLANLSATLKSKLGLAFL